MTTAHSIAVLANGAQSPAGAHVLCGPNRILAPLTGPDTSLRGTTGPRLTPNFQTGTVRHKETWTVKLWTEHGHSASTAVSQARRWPPTLGSQSSSLPAQLQDESSPPPSSLTRGETGVWAVPGTPPTPRHGRLPPGGSKTIFFFFPKSDKPIC